MTKAPAEKGSKPADRRPSREDAEAAVRTLIAWAGDDPDRPGLAETPQRVASAYQEFFRGYREDPLAVLADCVFEHVGGYDDLVILRDIRVESHCEHHIVPFIGRAHVAYLPRGRVAGLSRLARAVEILAKRLQTQEALTAEIADAIEQGLSPRGIGVVMEAEHQCMASRGVHQWGAAAVTTRFRGVLETDTSLRDRFLALVTAPRGGR
ncbi:MAG: GTP cyclohydrolase I FolE [Hyphomicrobiaceae bacterium]